MTDRAPIIEIQITARAREVVFGGTEEEPTVEPTGRVLPGKLAVTVMASPDVWEDDIISRSDAIYDMIARQAVIALARAMTKYWQKLEGERHAGYYGSSAMTDSVKIEIAGFKNRDMPRTPGKHTWIAMSVFGVDPTAKRWHFDRENLISVEGPGCYWCEEPYRPGMEKTECPGRPRR